MQETKERVKKLTEVAVAMTGKGHQMGLHSLVDACGWETHVDVSLTRSCEDTNIIVAEGGGR